MRLFYILFLCLFVSGCGIVPWYVSAAHTVGDIALMEETGKTSTEHVAGVLSEKDCQWTRLLDDVKVCMTKDELIDYILSKNCETVTWNWLGLPRCKKVLDKGASIW